MVRVSRRHRHVRKRRALYGGRAPPPLEGSGEAWLFIEDEIVKARHEEVFLRHDDERTDNRCAYLLFYCRTARLTWYRTGLSDVRYHFSFQSCSRYLHPVWMDADTTQSHG